MASKGHFPVENVSNENPPLSATIELSPLNGVFLLNRQKVDKKQTHLFMSKSDFKNVSLKNSSKVWFVEYYFKIPIELSSHYNFKDWKRFKVYEGINYLKGDEKEKFGKELLKAVKRDLEAGFNPFAVSVTEKMLDKHFEKLDEINYPTFLQCLQDFLNQKDDKNRSKDTIRSYKSYIAKIEAFLIDTQNADIKVNNINNELLNDFTVYLNDNYEIKETTYNNQIRFLATLINWMAQKPRNYIDRNSFDFGENTDLSLKKANVIKHQFYSSNIFQKVKTELENHPILFYYVKFIYYSCMRPEEVRCLKLSDIYLNERMIRILGKTGSRSIPICNELFDLINERYQNKLDFYIIGRDGLCSNLQASENYFARIFRRDIRPNLGLDDRYTIYGFKHTRVIHLLQAGYTDAEVMQLTGHRDTASYDQYKRDLMGNLNSKLTGETISF